VHGTTQLHVQSRLHVQTVWVVVRCMSLHTQLHVQVVWVVARCMTLLNFMCNLDFMRKRFGWWSGACRRAISSSSNLGGGPACVATRSLLDSVLKQPTTWMAPEVRHSTTNIRQPTSQHSRSLSRSILHGWRRERVILQPTSQRSSLVQPYADGAGGASFNKQPTRQRSSLRMARAGGASFNK